MRNNSTGGITYLLLHDVVLIGVHYNPLMRSGSKMPQCKTKQNAKKGERRLTKRTGRARFARTSTITHQRSRNLPSEPQRSTEYRRHGRYGQNRGIHDPELRRCKKTGVFDFGRTVVDGGRRRGKSDRSQQHKGKATATGSLYYFFLGYLSISSLF